MSRSHQQNQLCQEASSVESQGQIERASSLYREAVNLDRSNPTPYLFLGYSLAQQSKLEAAAAIFSLATDLSPLVINAWRNEQLDEFIRIRSKCADEVVRNHFTAMHVESVNHYQQGNPAADISRVSEAIWCQTHNQSFNYKHPQQRPHLFYIPGLAQVPIMARKDLHWSPVLEQAADDIRDEFLNIQQNGALNPRPYVGEELANLGEDWRPLAGTLAWGSFDLYKDGQPNTALLAHCPKTLAALARLPVLQVNNSPREVVFSVLQGGSHIPPHFGLANTDATVHLPLIVSPQSAIKVMDAVTDWQYGQTFAFDDSYLHESWNHSDQARVNLLFEVWHPDLSDDEQGIIEQSFAARLAWNRSRETWLS